MPDYDFGRLFDWWIAEIISFFFTHWFLTAIFVCKFMLPRIFRVFARTFGR